LLPFVFLCIALRQVFQLKAETAGFIIAPVNC